MIVEKTASNTLDVVASRVANLGLAHDGFKTGVVAAYLGMQA